MEDPGLKPFDYSRPDSSGLVPNHMMKGCEYRHKGNGMVYTVTGFSWDGSRDLWLVEHKRPSCIVYFSRPIANFLDRLEPV